MSPSTRGPERAPFGALRGAALLAWAAVVGMATLWPVRDGIPLPQGPCLVCGPNGTADALRNLALFAPLGALLAGTLPRPVVVAALALAVSGTVEALQWIVPGRHPSVGDLTFNASGALLGLALPWLAHRAAGGSRAVRRRTGLVFLVGALVVLAAPAALSRPVAPTGRMHVRLRPDFGHLALLPGTVSEARVGDRPFGSAITTPETELGGALLGGAPIVARFTLEGPLSHRRETGLVRVHDDAGRDVLFLGLRPGALLFRRLHLGDILRLEHPAATAPFDAAPGPALLTARAESTSDGACLAWGRDAAPAPTCGLGLTPGSAWRFVFDPVGLSGGARAGLSAAWVVVLMAPFGLTGPSRRGRVAATLAAWLTMLAAAMAGPLVGPPPLELLAVPLGLGLGVAARGAIPGRTL